MSITILGKKYKYNTHEYHQVLKGLVCFTYQLHFETISSFLSSDIGWGCTYRCGQMLLYNFFQSFENSVSINTFKDGYKNKYSIHNMVDKVTRIYNDYPGIWLGPCSLSFTLKEMTSRVIVSRDSVMYDSDVISRRQNTFPLLLVFPIKSSFYTLDFFKQILDFKLTNGIIGGKPRSSFYIIGYNENDELLYLDPHIILNTQQEKQVYKIKHTKLDPSILVSFTCKNSVEFEFLKNFINTRLEPRGIISIQTKNMTVNEDDIICF
jgi:hypothetical protein